MSRKTNTELVKAIRDKLTHDLRTRFDEDTLHRTREWRGELWKLMNEVEARLCPSPPAPPDRMLDRRVR
jgi:hypothetical protein